MRIGIDVRCLQDGTHSGVEEYVRALLEELFASDTENEYLLFANAWNTERIDFSWTERYRNVSVRLSRWPDKLLNLCFCYF